MEPQLTGAQYIHPSPRRQAKKEQTDTAIIALAFIAGEVCLKCAQKRPLVG
jgi:hypothetical protein